jgi:hypothetical protein
VLPINKSPVLPAQAASQPMPMAPFEPPQPRLPQDQEAP